jgi:hypothetical protein
MEMTPNDTRPSEPGLTLRQLIDQLIKVTEFMDEDKPVWVDPKKGPFLPIRSICTQGNSYVYLREDSQ